MSWKRFMLTTLGSAAVALVGITLSTSNLHADDEAACGFYSGQQCGYVCHTECTNSPNCCSSTTTYVKTAADTLIRPGGD